MRSDRKDLREDPKLKLKQIRLELKIQLQLLVIATHKFTIVTLGGCSFY